MNIALGHLLWFCGEKLMVLDGTGPLKPLNGLRSFQETDIFYSNISHYCLTFNEVNYLR